MCSNRAANGGREESSHQIINSHTHTHIIHTHTHTSFTCGRVGKEHSHQHCGGNKRQAKQRPASHCCCWHCLQATRFEVRVEMVQNQQAKDCLCLQRGKQTNKQTILASQNALQPKKSQETLQGACLQKHCSSFIEKALRTLLSLIHDCTERAATQETHGALATKTLKQTTGTNMPVNLLPATIHHSNLNWRCSTNLQPPKHTHRHTDTITLTDPRKPTQTHFHKQPETVFEAWASFFEPHNNSNNNTSTLGNTN